MGPGNSWAPEQHHTLTVGLRSCEIRENELKCCHSVLAHFPATSLEQSGCSVASPSQDWFLQTERPETRRLPAKLLLAHKEFCRTDL